MADPVARRSEYVHVVETIPALEGKGDDLRIGLRKLVPICRKEKGCISYDLFQDRANPNLFTVIMKWEHQVDYEAHNQAPHITAFAEKFRNVLYRDEQIIEHTLVQLV